jgi:hypothetical protein
MPRYIVQASELVTQYVNFIVEAENEDEARDKVIDGDFEDSYIIDQYHETPLKIHSIDED